MIEFTIIGLAFVFWISMLVDSAIDRRVMRDLNERLDRLESQIADTSSRVPTDRDGEDT